jgi:hypothetical protein
VNLINIQAEREISNDSISVYIGHRDEAGKLSVVSQMLVPHEAGTVMEPSLRLKRDHAQRLMDELWNCGLRPSEGSGSAGSLAATERHLADMRRLVFEAKGMTQ